MESVTIFKSKSYGAEIKTHRDPRIALVPCGHQRFYEPCANEVERQGRGCSI